MAGSRSLAPSATQSIPFPRGAFCAPQIAIRGWPLIGAPDTGGRIRRAVAARKLPGSDQPLASRGVLRVVHLASLLRACRRAQVPFLVPARVGVAARCSSARRRGQGAQQRGACGRYFAHLSFKTTKWFEMLMALTIQAGSPASAPPSPPIVCGRGSDAAGRAAGAGERVEREHRVLDQLPRVPPRLVRDRGRPALAAPRWVLGGADAGLLLAPRDDARGRGAALQHGASRQELPQQPRVAAQPPARDQARRARLLGAPRALRRLLDRLGQPAPVLAPAPAPLRACRA
jgi:hypothetical protein